MNTVKPLEWKDGRNDQTVFDVVQVAVILGADDLIGLNYTVLGPDRHGLYEVVLGCKIIKTCDSEAAAKSSAFADYSARIMSTIEPAGVGVETAPPQTHLTVSLASALEDILPWAEEKWANPDAISEIVNARECLRAALTPSPETRAAATKEATHD